MAVLLAKGDEAWVKAGKLIEHAFPLHARDQYQTFIRILPLTVWGENRVFLTDLGTEVAYIDGDALYTENRNAFVYAFFRDAQSRGARTALWTIPVSRAMLAFSAVHDFVLGPAAGRAEAGSNAAIVLRRKAALNARLTALLGLALVYVAVRLARGG